MPAGSYRFQVGRIACTVLTDGYASYPTPWLFPNADPGRLFQALETRRQPRDTVLSPFTCLLIQTGRQTILVDTGGGADAATAGAIVARLDAAGVHPRDVDTVVFTHAHPDHTGGAIDVHGRPAFPNARHVLSEFEYEFWMGRRPEVAALQLPESLKFWMPRHAQGVLEALRHQLEPVYQETEIAPGLRLLPAPGHTPGHLALLLASDGQGLLHLGDAAVHPLHLEEPDWENGFDLAPAAATATRRTLMERAAAENMLVMAFHFPFPSVGKAARRPEGGWRWTPGF